MNKPTVLLLSTLMTGCLIPVEVARYDAGEDAGGSGGGAGGGGGGAGGDAGTIGPDLTVTLVQAPSTAAAGSLLTILRSIKNIGNAGAPDNKFSCFVTATTVILVDGSQPTTGSVTLAAGASDTGTSTILVPPTLAPGSYYVGCIADVARAVAETNEENNTRVSNAIQITAPADAGSADGGSTDGGVLCTAGANGSCNDDLAMSAIAGTCVDNACVCNSGFEVNPASGRCKLYYARYPISAVKPEAYALAIEPGQNRAGLAWIAAAADAGSYDVFYRDWQYSAPGGAPAEHLATVQVHAGIAVAFRSSRPVVSFLGGGSDGSPVWKQSDAVIYERGTNGSWQMQTVATMGNQVSCGNPVSDTGFLVGLWPSLAVDGNKTFLAWRDAHNGQFPQQDWAGSDLEVAESSTGAPPWNYQCAKAGGNDKRAHGQSSRMVLVNGEPALVYTHGFAGIRDASDVTFVRRAAGFWQGPIEVFSISSIVSPTADALGLAYSPVTGFTVVAGNANASRVTLITSSSNGSNWLQPNFVGNSAGGADVAVDSSGLRYVSVVDCPKPVGTACASSSEWVVSLWTEAMVGAAGLNFWRGPTVDSQAADAPTRLGLFANGKRAVLYQAGPTAELRLAVER